MVVMVSVMMVVIVEIDTTPARNWLRCAINRAGQDFVNMSRLGYHCGLLRGGVDTNH